MQTAQPAASPLGILLLVAAIYLVVTSPKKLRTLGRMAIALVVTVLLIIVAGPSCAGATRRPWEPLQYWLGCSRR